MKNLLHKIGLGTSEGLLNLRALLNQKKFNEYVFVLSFVNYVKVVILLYPYYFGFIVGHFEYLNLYVIKSESSTEPVNWIWSSSYQSTFA